MSHILDNIRVTGVVCPLCGSKDTVANPTEGGSLRVVCRSCDQKGGTTYVVDDLIGTLPVLPALAAEAEADALGEIDIVVERTDVPLVKVAERVRGTNASCAICESTPGLCALHAEGYEDEPRYTRSSASNTVGVAPEYPEAPAGPQTPGESPGEASHEVRAVPSRGIGQR